MNNYLKQIAIGFLNVSSICICKSVYSILAIPMRYVLYNKWIMVCWVGLSSCQIHRLNVKPSESKSTTLREMDNWVPSNGFIFRTFVNSDIGGNYFWPAYFPLPATRINKLKKLNTKYRSAVCSYMIQEALRRAEELTQAYAGLGSRIDIISQGSRERLANILEEELDEVRSSSQNKSSNAIYLEELLLHLVKRGIEHYYDDWMASIHGKQDTKKKEEAKNQIIKPTLKGLPSFLRAVSKLEMALFKFSNKQEFNEKLSDYKIDFGYPKSISLPINENDFLALLRVNRAYGAEGAVKSYWAFKKGSYESFASFVYPKIEFNNRAFTSQKRIHIPMDINRHVYYQKSLPIQNFERFSVDKLHQNPELTSDPLNIRNIEANRNSRALVRKEKIRRDVFPLEQLLHFSDAGNYFMYNLEDYDSYREKKFSAGARLEYYREDDTPTVEEGMVDIIIQEESGKEKIVHQRFQEMSHADRFIKTRFAQPYNKEDHEANRGNILNIGNRGLIEKYITKRLYKNEETNTYEIEFYDKGGWEKTLFIIPIEHTYNEVEKMP